MTAGGRVLVVDDDESIRDLLRLTLSEEGYEVTEAADGIAALESVDRSPPGLILLDLRMPRLDGWGFYRAYRRRPGPHAPIMVITAARDAKASAAALSPEAVLDKPFDLDELTGLVKRLLPPQP